MRYNHCYHYGLERFAAVTDGETTDYRYDILGNLRHTRDADGTATATFQYDPWGNPEQGDPAPFGFTGELHDQGLVHLRARWYHPQHGTFTTKDPFPGIGSVPASQHPYQYALNSPMRFTDPSGEVVPALLGAVALGAILGGLVEYGSQMYDQHRTTGRIDWGAYCRDEVIIAALGGGVAGGVGFVFGPLTALGRGSGIGGSLFWGALEGATSDVAATIVMRTVRGQPVTMEHLVTTAVGGTFGGLAGGWLGWKWRRGWRTPPYIGPVDSTAWHPGRPGVPLDLKPAVDASVRVPFLTRVFGHPLSRHAPADLAGFVHRTLDNDLERFHDVIEVLNQHLPSGTTVIVRGSTVNGYKWATGRAFDRGTAKSDLDMVLLGEATFQMWTGPHKARGQQTLFLSPREREWRDTAPALRPLAEELEVTFGRSVNLVGIRPSYFYVRQFIQQTPYLRLLEK